MGKAVEKVFLAVDLGASGGKCFAGFLAEDAFRMSEVHRFAHEAVSYFIPDRTGRVTERTHWDDTGIYAGILGGLRAFRREVGPDLDGVGIDTWGADGNLVSADGETIGKLYCYRDHRLDDMSDRIRSAIDPLRLYAITGIPCQPFNISNQLHWLVANRPELLVEGSVYLPAPSLFLFYLCGARILDSAWASVTQLADARTRTWSAEVTERLGIPASLLPRIVDPGTRVGRLHGSLAAHLGIAEADLYAVASHDTACAFAAAPVSSPEDALVISSGTWSLVGRLLPEPLTTPAAFEAGLSNEGGIGGIRFLRNVMGTWPVQELRRQWRAADGHEMTWAEMNTLTEQAPPLGALIDPDDASFYNPADMEEAMVSFCRRTGQEPPRDRGAFLRCVYESLALKYRYVNERIAGVCGRQSRRVHVVGGGSRNELLNRFTADALDLPVEAGPEEATAAGNLLTQAWGAGCIPDMDHARMIVRESFPIREYRPENPGAWDAVYERFLRLL